MKPSSAMAFVSSMLGRVLSVASAFANGVVLPITSDEDRGYDDNQSQTEFSRCDDFHDFPLLD